MKTEIISRFRELLTDLADDGRAELRQQGHVATGRGLASIEGQLTKVSADTLEGVVLANDYLIPVDTGIPRSRIPFSPGSGAPPSKYISGLIRWAGVVRPGLSDQERKSFAFAVAYKHLSEGMPTRGSFAYSNNGRRKNWIRFGLENKEQELVDRLRIFQILNESFGREILNAIRK